MMDDSLLHTIAYLKTRQRILFLTTSNRWSGEHGGEMPKSTQLAYTIAEQVGTDKVTILEVPKLKIFPCEGNVSTARGNTCGLLTAMLKDPSKNPTGHHRCWASINNPDDELWKVSKALFESDTVLFFASIRWGQMNSYYQKLIERLTWLENRHSTLGEDNLIKDTHAGVIAVGHNWNGANAVATQKQVLSFYGFQVRDELCWNWQYTENLEDETDTSYQDAAKAFDKTFIHPDSS